MTQAEQALVEYLPLESLSVSLMQNKQEIDTDAATSFHRLGLYLVSRAQCDRYAKPASTITDGAISQETSEGQRLLPVKRYLSWTISAGNPGHPKILRLRLHLVTVGSEREVGVAKFSFKDFLPSPAESQAISSNNTRLRKELEDVSTWLSEPQRRGRGNIEVEKPAFEPVMDLQSARSVIERCLGGLWQLEREIWASRTMTTSP